MKDINNTCFVFCHGFGFDATFWTTLQPYFSNMKTIYLDLGYFGELQCMPEWDESINYIGVGHSLGLLKLMSLHVSFKRLIGLHGFVNFLGAAESLNRRRQRELIRLIRQFNTAPESTLEQFYQRTGVDFKWPEASVINRARLLDDLVALAQPVVIPMDVPMLILSSSDDIIVSPEVIHDNFSAYPHIRIEMLNDARHGLGYLKPDVIYQYIMQFVGS